MALKINDKTYSNSPTGEVNAGDLRPIDLFDKDSGFSWQMGDDGEPRLMMQWKPEMFNAFLSGKPIAETYTALCKCGQSVHVREFVISDDVEISHPLNKGKCSDSKDLHYTHFESCPHCKRVLFADHRPVHAVQTK